MTSPNHIVGGIAITGISLSFWDINIFSNATYLSLCIFSSLLPDVDHTKSIIGKMFYPLAKYLDTRFGHRTITHSLTALIPLFIFFLFLELNLINPYFERIGTDFSLIFLFAYLSHLILDMLTVQGIPMFYPFMKNPCVIPANPSLRFRSGNIKSEAIALFIFTFVLFTSYDLFENGFWTTYNRSFGTVKHAFREFKDSEKIVSAHCKFSFNGEKKEVSGYILDANENKLELWIDDNIKPRVFIIDNKDLRFKNIDVQVAKTVYKYSVIDLDFFNLTLQEINDTLKHKIVSGKIISSSKFIVNNHKASKGNIELNKEISPRFQWIENDTIKRELASKLELKKSKLYEIQNLNFKEIEKQRGLKNILFQYKLNLNKAESIYERNKYEKLIIEQKKNIESFKINLKNTAVVLTEINQIKEELNYKEKHYFTGDLKIYSIPKNDEDFELASNKK